MLGIIDLVEQVFFVWLHVHTGDEHITGFPGHRHVLPLRATMGFLLSITPAPDNGSTAPSVQVGLYVPYSILINLRKMLVAVK
jgi:hypothetical protein